MDHIPFTINKAIPHGTREERKNSSAEGNCVHGSLLAAEAKEDGGIMVPFC